MSLLTDALRLREGRRSSRGESGPSFPPFRGPRPGRWIAGALAVCVLTVLAWWKGLWVVEKIEEFAGVAPIKPSPNLLASAARETPTEKPLSKEEGEALAEPAALPAAPGPKAEKPLAEISPEGKQKGEILLKDSLVRAVAEKAAAPAAPVKPALAEMPAALPVPEGGLKPMKVELAEAEMVLETPEEREKKRTTEVEEFLRVLKVQGVRLQGRESRILVEGAPIGLGEKVGALGLVLESVEPQKIIFSDASGKKYPKSY